jgi:aminomethyltransferase
MSSEDSLPSEAETVIVGAGIVGCNAAYQLANLGREDVVVIDQGPLPTTGGSSSHAPGIMFQTAESEVMTKFAMYSNELYSDLEFEGQPVYNEVGGIEVARSDERMDYLRRRVEWAESWGVPDPQLLSPEEVAEKLPLVDPDEILGGYYSPTDGQASGVKACAALIERASDMGVDFHAETAVTDVEVEDGAVQAVVTEKGRIKCDELLGATNIWSPQLGKMVGVDIPVAPVIHQYTVTESLPELANERELIADGAVRENYESVSGEGRAERLLANPDRPILRDQDNALYFRTHGDAYGIGSYNHESVVPDPFDLGRNEDYDDQASLRDFTERYYEEATHPDRPDKAPRRASDELLPATDGVTLEQAYDGMFSISPNEMPVLGEHPDVDGFWTAMAVWISHAGGAGRAVAEWMVTGTPGLDGEPIDLHDFDVGRFQPHAGAKSYWMDMAALEYRHEYSIVHPRWQRQRQRDLRRSPFYEAEKELDAEFHLSGEFERPHWYESNESLLEEYGEQVPERGAWEGKHWSPIAGAEHLAVRDRVGLFDQSSFVKIELAGDGAADFAQRLVTNDVDVEPGKLRYTAMLNEEGGVMADFTVTRLAEDRFLILTGGGAGGRETLHWIRKHAADEASVSVHDRTSGLCGLGVWGPESRNLLSKIAETDVSGSEFPFYTTQQMCVEGIPVLALRLSYVGELGYELYAPAEYGPKLWETVWDAGEEYGVLPAGLGAQDSMRVEKGYRLWGEDVHTEHTPYEADIGFSVDLDTEFIGKEALVESKEAGLDKRIVCLVLDDPDAVVMKDKPVLDGGDVLSYTYSAEYCYSIGSGVAYAYLPAEYAEPGVEVEIRHEGALYSATVQEEPLFDPENDRMFS